MGKFDTMIGNPADMHSKNLFGSDSITFGVGSYKIKPQRDWAKTLPTSLRSTHPTKSTFDQLSKLRAYAAIEFDRHTD